LGVRAAPSERLIASKRSPSTVTTSRLGAESTPKNEHESGGSAAARASQG
jgi:hypothetical protein